MNYRTLPLAVFGLFLALGAIGFATPTLAASYCDSQGNCTGPSGNDWNRYQWSGDPVQRSNSNYSYGNNSYGNNNYQPNYSYHNPDEDYHYEYSYNYSYANSPNSPRYVNYGNYGNYANAPQYSYSQNSYPQNYSNYSCPSGTYEYQGGCAPFQTYNNPNNNQSWMQRHFSWYWR